MDEIKLYILTIPSNDTSKKDVVKSTSNFLKQKYIGEYSLNEYGKPISNSIFFNISHSGSYIVLATSVKRNIGIDIEIIRPISNKLKQYVAHEAEVFNDDIDFLKSYTRKEALLKCIGKGIDRRLDEINVNDDIICLDNKEYRCLTISEEQYVLSIVLEGIDDIVFKQEK